MESGFKHVGRLTFSHRVAHDEIGPGGEGVHGAGVHHHLIRLQLAVHGIAGGHWIVVLVSAARLETDRAAFTSTASFKNFMDFKVKR